MEFFAFCKGHPMNGLLTRTPRALTARTAGYYSAAGGSIFLAMKLTAVILLAFSLHLAARTHSQSISFSGRDVSLKRAIAEIKKQTGFLVVYNKELIKNAQRVTVNVHNQPLTDFLDLVLENQQLSYSIKDNNILISYRPGSISPFNRKPAEPVDIPPISGIVREVDGLPLAGVNIQIKGTNKGVITDADGRFTIDAPPNAIMIISFVGFITREVPVAQGNINIVLERESESLNQVVVVGYGTAKKATLTGSVTAIKGAELVKAPSTNLSNSLAGRLPGLTAVTRSGEPGQDGSILRIRGSNTLNDNSPLVVVDGIPGRAMERIDPADIESITILKDASAAIYGARAANGVILVTTRRGLTGKPQLTVSLNQGWASPTVIPKMADAATYAQMINEIKLYRQRDPLYTDEMIELYKNGSDPLRYPNTDWFKETFKPYSVQNYANVSVTGGTENVRYMFSVGTKFQDGTYRNSATNYSQVNFRSNIDAKLNKFIRVSFDLAGRQEKRNYPTRSSSIIYSSTLRGKPNVRAYWPNGLPGPDIERGENPVVLATSETGYDRDKTYVLESIGKIDIDIPWVKGLSITGNVSFDKAISNRKLWQKPWNLYYWDGQTLDADNQPVLNKGIRGFAEPRLTQSLMDGGRTMVNTLINYSTTISKEHNIKILAGAERIKGDTMTFSAFRRYFITAAADQLFAGGDLEKDNNGSASVNSRLNYFGRFNYNFSEKYLVEFVFRYDGSYIFPEGKRFGFFPGISLGWRISQEKFWQDHLSFIRDFKIRGSWGQTGNDRISPYQYLASYGFSGVAIFNESVENKALAELRIPNPNVTWEISNQSNIGFDAQFLNGRLSVTADYFSNLRTNILHFRNASVPATSGIVLPRENIGKVINKGFDFEVSYRGQAGTLRYTVSVNGGHQKNKIKFWDETPGAPIYQQSTGHPMNSGLYYNAMGIFKDQAAVDAYPHWDNARPGDIVFEDVNKDGQLNGLDRVRNDKTDLPTFSGGLSVDLQYRSFYLSVLLQGASGAIRNHYSFSGESGNYFDEDAIGRWTPDNINATKPRTWNYNEEYWMASPNSYWLRNNDYIRLKNVELGYTIPQSVNKRLGIKGSSVYVSGLNLLTFDKLTNWDPETSSSTPYPSSKVLNVGLNVTL